MKKSSRFALTCASALFYAGTANAELLAYYGDGLLEDLDAEANLATPVAGITVSDLDSFGVLAGSGPGDVPPATDFSRVTRPSFGTDTPAGPTAGSAVGSEWLECRSRENLAPISADDNYFFFTLTADPGSSIDLTSLKYDFWLSDGGVNSPAEADAEAFVSVDGGGFTSYGSIQATDTLGHPVSAPVSSADLDLSAITGAQTVEVRIVIGYTVGNSNGISGFVQGIQLEGSAGGAIENSFDLVITPNAGTPGNYDFRWESQTNYLYDLVSSTDMTTSVDTWPVWMGNENIIGTAPENVLTDIPGGGDPKRFFAVIEKDPLPLLSSDFEADNGGFSFADGSGGSGTPWEWGAPDSDNGFGSTVTSGNAESTNCWATNLGDFTGTADAGFYNTDTDGALVSPIVSFIGVTSATLSFAQALDLDSGDIAQINFLDSDDSDNVVGTIAVTDGDTNASPWEDRNFPVPPEALDKNIKIEWRLTSGGLATGFIGWYIDDVVVTSN